MRGTLVLVRGYGMQPFQGRVLSENQRGLRVARADANLDTPNVLAAGIPWDDAFKHDPSLMRKLTAAASAGNAKALSALWEKARPLRQN